MTRAVTFTLLFLSVARLAFAADERAADAMITRGLELRREGKSVEALEMLQRAHAIAPSPRSLGQLGLVELSLDHWSEAEDHLAASIVTDQDPWVHKNRALLDQALSLAKSHVGQIALSGPDGATVTIGGKIIGTLPHAQPVRVGEGTAIVTATAPGFKQFILSVPVQAGMETPLKIALDPVDVRPPAPSNSAPVSPPSPTPSATPSPTPELSTHYSWRTWTGGTLVGVGAGVAGWGVAWIVLDGRTTSGTCTPGAPAGCLPVYNTKTAGWILTAGGAATAAVGGFLLYGAKKSGSDVTIGFGPTSLLLGGHF
jgi:hypothetical protein